MGELKIKASSLSKNFGSIVAVDRLSFEVGSGEVLGFLGPNGAGKSTTMKMLTGFLVPSGGTATINGLLSCAGGFTELPAQESRPLMKKAQTPLYRQRAR